MQVRISFAISVMGVGADPVDALVHPESNYISGQVIVAAAVSSFDVRADAYRSSWMTEELDTFRNRFRKFLTKSTHAEKWRDQKLVDRSAWRALGEMGALLPSVPEAYGGLGATFAYDAAILEDIESVVPEVTTGVSVHSAIVAHYILNYGTEEQKQRWLPRMASGELVGAIAMTEPGTGSDLQGVRTTRARSRATTTSSTVRRPSSPTARPPT